MNATKKQKKIERLYLKVRPTIIGVCASFMKQYGGDMEELVSESHLHFMNILATHDPKRQKLEADVQYRLFQRLLATHRTESRRKRLLNAVPATEFNCSVDPEPFFDLGGFMEDLSGEAQEVVKLAFNAPPDVEMEIVQRGERTPTNTRAAIKQYLRDCTWTLKQIRESFAEIRNALTGD